LGLGIIIHEIFSDGVHPFGRVNNKDRLDKTEKWEYQIDPKIEDSMMRY
jgi:hypothetical protein